MQWLTALDSNIGFDLCEWSRAVTLQDVVVVLENMSSVNNIVGGKIWHLKYIIDKVHDKDRVGICIDTCHLFSSGQALVQHRIPGRCPTFSVVVSHKKTCDAQIVLCQTIWTWESSKQSKIAFDLRFFPAALYKLQQLRAQVIMEGENWRLKRVFHIWGRHQ